MNILSKLAIPALCCMLFGGCDLIDYHPYDVRIDGETGINDKNIARIETLCQGKDTLRFAFMGDSQRWYDETQDFVTDVNRRDDIDFVIHGGDLSDFGVHFDVFTYESDIRKSGKIEEAIAFFKEKGLAYEQDGALFLKTSAYLDDKDRPIVKKDGTYTYFMPDIAYHYDKLSRGFDLLVDMLGADHHGYLARMKSALMMKGYPENALEFGLYQIVRVYKNGEEVKMSKRTGKAVAHRDLVAEVGVDAVRYFFSERSGDTHLDFNLDLALSKSKENPVYYSQYAYARCHSVLTLAEPLEPRLTAGTLVLPLEGEILKQLASFPAMIESAGEARAPHKVAGYVYRLAALVHDY